MSTISTTLVAASDESDRVRIDSTLFAQSCYLGAHLQLAQGFACGSCKRLDRIAASLDGVNYSPARTTSCTDHAVIH